MKPILNDYLIILNNKDTVGTIRKELACGNYCLRNIKEILDVKIKPGAKIGFKIAIDNIKKGEFVYKYGQVIGIAKININRGDVVHIENLASTIK